MLHNRFLDVHGLHIPLPINSTVIAANNQLHENQLRIMVIIDLAARFDYDDAGVHGIVCVNVIIVVRLGRQKLLIDLEGLFPFLPGDIMPRNSSSSSSIMASGTFRWYNR